MSDNKILKPEIMVFAGPNGSGKSTITRMAKTVGILLLVVKRKKDAKSRLFTGILRLFLLLSCQTRDYTISNYSCQNNSYIIVNIKKK